MTDSSGKRAPQTIAIDGPAAAGKSSVARRVADRLGYLVFDTGVLYRAATLLSLRHGVSNDDAGALAQVIEEHTIDVVARPGSETGYAVLIDGADVSEAIRSPQVASSVSPVSAHAEVRHALMPPQRRIAARGRVVMVGRDIGTVILPDADLKIYLDASAEARARRRFRERLSRGEPADFEEILETVQARDAVDAGRAVAPLRAAADAVVVNTDDCDLDGVVEHILALVDRWPDRLTTGGGRAPCGAPLPETGAGSLGEGRT